MATNEEVATLANYGYESTSETSESDDSSCEIVDEGGGSESGDSFVEVDD